MCPYHIPQSPWPSVHLRASEMTRPQNQLAKPKEEPGDPIGHGLPIPCQLKKGGLKNSVNVKAQDTTELFPAAYDT